MTLKQDRGNRGEDIAAEYLKSKGYTIIERNHRKAWGELDIVAQAGDSALVFVEVKAISGGAITPEHNMTPAKIMKTKRAALAYANANPRLSSGGWRIDVVAIDLRGNMATEIRHYENI